MMIEVQAVRYCGHNWYFPKEVIEGALAKHQACIPLGYHHMQALLGCLEDYNALRFSLGLNDGQGVRGWWSKQMVLECSGPNLKASCDADLEQAMREANAKHGTCYEERAVA